MSTPHAVRRRRRGLRAVSAVAAAGLVGGVTAVIAAGAGPASAAAINASFNVHCTIPVAGSEAYTAKLTATAPTTAQVGDSVSLQNFSMSIELNSATTDALQTLGATTLQGSITPAASLTTATPSTLSITANVPSTPVPQTADAPPFTITATGVSPSATLTAAGTATLTATTVSAVFDPQDDTGRSVLPVAKRNIPCTFDAGQSLVLTTIAVTAAGSTPTPVPVTPTMTASPNPVPVGTSAVTISGTGCLAPAGGAAPSVEIDILSSDVINVYSVSNVKPDGTWTTTLTPPTPSTIMGGSPDTDTVTATCSSGSTAIAHYGLELKFLLPSATPVPIVTPTPVVTVTPKPVVTPTPKATPTPTPQLTPLNFSANGTIGIPTIDGTGKLGPGVVATQLDLRGRSFTGTTTLPNINISAKLFGFIPTDVVASFTQLGQLTGTILPGATDITAELKANIGVVSVKALGVLPLTSGNCQTVSPVSIHLASNGKGQFSVFSGGTVASTFAIGPVANCGALTGLLNAIFPGPNNTLSLNLVAQS